MRRHLIAIIVLSLFLMGCSSSGAPTDYDSTVEDNYVSGCRVALDSEQFNNVDAVCRCSYTNIAAEIPFPDFEGLNKRLRDDITILKNPASDSVAPKALKIVSDCILSVPLGT